MANKIRFSATIVTAMALVLTGSLFSQHTTSAEDAIKSGGTRSILRTLNNPKMDASDPRFFTLRANLYKALGDPAHKNNMAVVNQLIAGLGEGTVTRVNYNNMNPEYWKVRAESAIALGRVGNKAAIPALLSAINEDPDLHVQVCSIRALGLIKDRKAVPRLLDHLARTNVDLVAMELIIALERIGDKRAFPLLLAVSQRNFSRSVRTRALNALKNLRY